MADQGNDVDRLYQLPPDEFTAARNALAKAMGKSGGEIRKLAKPNAAAWAVNQLYWQRPKAYERLVRAADALRDAHRAMLAGKKTDLAAAEAAHDVALKASLDEIRALLRLAGDAAPLSTIREVTDTLRALPASGDEPLGRLSRPLKPSGLEALAGLTVKGVPLPRRAEGKRAGAAARPSAEAARRLAADERRAEKRRQVELRDARAAERTATAALAKAKHALGAAQQERDRLADRQRFLTKQIDDLVDDVARRERELNDAAAARVQLER